MLSVLEAQMLQLTEITVVNGLVGDAVALDVYESPGGDGMSGKR